MRQRSGRKGVKKDALDRLEARAFAAPTLDGRRMAFRFDDRESVDLIPDVISYDSQTISNPQIEPEIRKIKIDPVWFNGPELPRWATRWYDNAMGQTEQTHTVALWMLVCIALLSLEWLTRKLLKIA